jgi:hypothetical protein
MRLPIKLNKAGWPWPFADLGLAFHDPRPLAYEPFALSAAQFSASGSSLQFGVTFKTTHPRRHAQSNRLLREAYRGSRPVILDVGASDGSTSLDLIQDLDSNFTYYYITDLNLSVRCGHDPKSVVYFADPDGTCILRASERFLVYSNTSRAILPFRLIAKALLLKCRYASGWRNLVLVQPDLLSRAKYDRRIIVRQYDMFVSWTGPPPDLIKVANLLNNQYFSDAQIKNALQVQCSNLAPNGRLLLISEDRDVEKFSVFRKTPTGMQLEWTHAGGAKAARHVAQVELESANVATAHSMLD